jgi:hypothetical protein
MATLQVEEEEEENHRPVRRMTMKIFGPVNSSDSIELNVMVTGKDMKGSSDGTLRTAAETVSLCLGRRGCRKLTATFCDKMLDKYRKLVI